MTLSKASSSLAQAATFVHLNMYRNVSGNANASATLTGNEKGYVMPRSPMVQATLGSHKPDQSALIKVFVNKLVQDPSPGTLNCATDHLRHFKGTLYVHYVGR